MSLLYEFLPLLILAHLVFEHYLCIKFPTAPRLYYLRASLCKILISSFAHKMDFAHNFSVDFV